jgi:hypothetical protein
MTRDEAVQTIKALFRVFESDTAGLNEKGLGGILLPEADLYFEYDSGTGNLVCRGAIHSPKVPFTANELEALTREAASGAPSAGGHLEYMAENGGVFLTRTYAVVVPDETFVSGMRDLARATLLWRREVLPRALTRVHTGTAAAR